MAEDIAENTYLPAYAQVPVAMELMCIFYAGNPESLAHAQTSINFILEEVHEEVAKVLKIRFSTMPPTELMTVQGKNVVNNLKNQLTQFKEALQKQVIEGGTNICEFKQIDGANTWIISYILMPNGDIHKIYRDTENPSVNISVILDAQNELHLPKLRPGEAFRINSMSL